MKAIVRSIGCVLVAALWAASLAAAPLGTGFTYQGQLVQSGSPVTGSVTLRFSLWDALSGGSQVGSTQIAPGVAVTSGLFVVQLDDAGQFGANAFNGDARWLQIEVCADAACAAPPTLLTPRQPITPAPYARHAAGPWASDAGTLSYTGGRVGIGTATPNALLELQSGFGTDVLRFGLDAADYHSVTTSYHGAQPYLNYLGFNVEHGPNDTRRVLTMQGDGRVVVGTSPATGALEVRGAVNLGDSGELYAPGGVENTRIVRGLVSAGGLPFYGTGFTSTIQSTGNYMITFTTPFAGHATIVATTANTGIPAIAIADATFNSTVSVKTYTLAGAPVSVPFHFIAIGPR